MKKKLLTIFLLLFCAITMCGCANVNYGVTISSNGMITQELTVTLDSAELVSKGINPSQVENDIKTYANTVVMNFYTNFMFNPKTTPEMKEAVKNGMNPNNGTTLVKFEKADKYVQVKLTLQFANIRVYQYFYGIDPNEEKEDNTTQKDNLFYVKEMEESTTIFHDLENNAIAKQWLQYFADAGFTLADSTYTYSYSTPFQHLYSDADYTQIDEEGNKVHIWVFKSTDLAANNETGDTITFYQVYFRPSVWYIAAVILTAVLIIVLIIISAVKNKKKDIQVEIN